MIKKVVGIAIAIAVFAALVPNLNAAIVRDTLLNEDFNGTWLPAGWTTQALGGGGSQANWHKSSNRAYLGWEYRSGTTDRLIAPTVDCSDSRYETVWLKVQNDFNWYGWPYDFTARIRGSDDGGSSYPEILWEDEQANYVSVDFYDISAWALGETEIRVDFYGYGNTYSINWWQIDNVVIYGEWEEGSGGELDMEMVEIIRPIDPEEVSVTFTPTCRVYCNQDDVTAKVICKIEKIGGGVTPYNETLNNYPFDKGYETVDAFKDYTPPESGKYKVTFIVEHPDDINEDNNDLNMNFDAVLTAQVDVTEILAPEDMQYNAFSPHAKFSEMISTATEDAVMRCEITDMALHAVVYVDSSDVESFEADEEKTYTFREVATDEIPSGAYTVRFWATQGKDNTAIGEEMTKNFDYEGIAETPVLETYTLDVVGSTVNFSVGAATDVSVRIYDASGKMVAELASGHHSAGSYSLNWDANAASGIYFVKMITPDFSASGKLLRLY